MPPGGCDCWRHGSADAASTNIRARSSRNVARGFVLSQRRFQAAANPSPVVDRCSSQLAALRIARDLSGSAAA
jgi:hypothetical protein